MVATATVYEITGASGSKTYTSITNRVRLFSADQATNQGTPQTTNPVVIPASNYNYSYWKAVCLLLSGSGFTVSNIRHYSNGDVTSTWQMGTSGRLQRGNRDTGDKGCPDGDYAQAGGTVGTTGYDIADPTNGHWYFKGQTTSEADVNSDTSGSPATIDSATYTTVSYTNHVVLQVRITNNATQGTQTAVTLTWMYDEQ